MSKTKGSSGQVRLVNAAIERGICIKFFVEEGSELAAETVHLLPVREFKPLATLIEALTPTLAASELQAADYVICKREQMLLAVFRSQWCVMGFSDPSSITDGEWALVAEQLCRQQRSIALRAHELAQPTKNTQNDSFGAQPDEESASRKDPTDMQSASQAGIDPADADRYHESVDILLKAALRWKKSGGTVQFPGSRNDFVPIVPPSPFALKPDRNTQGEAKVASGIVTGVDLMNCFLILDGRTAVECPSVSTMSPETLLGMLGKPFEARCINRGRLFPMTILELQGDLLDER